MGGDRYLVEMARDRDSVPMVWDGDTVRVSRNCEGVAVVPDCDSVRMTINYKFVIVLPVGMCAGGNPINGARDFLPVRQREAGVLSYAVVMLGGAVSRRVAGPDIFRRQNGRGGGDGFLFGGGGRCGRPAAAGACPGLVVTGGSGRGGPPPVGACPGLVVTGGRGYNL